jgi:hypothetical protein
MSQFTYFNYYCMTNYEKRLNKIRKSYTNKKKRTTLVDLTCIIYRQKKTQKDKYKKEILWIFLDKR